jgi:hypothetical protein
LTADNVIRDQRMRPLQLHRAPRNLILPRARPVPAPRPPGDRLVEAQHINRSLSALGDVIAALASHSSHVGARAAPTCTRGLDVLCPPLLTYTTSSCVEDKFAPLPHA